MLILHIKLITFIVAITAFSQCFLVAKAKACDFRYILYTYWSAKYNDSIH